MLKNSVRTYQNAINNHATQSVILYFGVARYTRGMRIKDMHTTDMPREKLVRYGAARLSDHELLAVLLGSGTKGMNVLALSKKVLALLRARGTDGVSAADLAAVRGIGAAKGAQIIALLALTERLHNHGRAEVLSANNPPSGSLEPSPEDIDVTIRLKNAGELLGINLLDHVILTDTTYKSISLTAAQ